MATRGFTGKPPSEAHSDRIPPGQHLVENFPVLTAGPTPRVSLADWSFTLKIGPRPVKRWTWTEFEALAQTKMTRDIHCVTKWSKLNTPWAGVLIDDLLAEAGLEPRQRSSWRTPMTATRQTFPWPTSLAAER